MRKILILMVCCCTFVCSGCRDIFYLEDTDIELVIGLDKGENNQFVYYSVVPVFDQNVKKKYDVQVVKDGRMLHEARKQANAQTAGYLSSRKLQVLLLSKDLLKEENVYPHLDVLFRNPKSELHSEIAVVDGQVADVINLNWDEKGQPGVVLKYLLDQGYKNGNTLPSSLYRYKRQMLDDRVTPYLAEITKQGGKLKVVGTTLLNHDGKYQLTLDTQESTLLQMLKSEIKTSVSLPIRLPVKQEMKKIVTDVIDVSRNVKTQLKRQQLVINVDLQLTIELYELPFFYPNDKYKMKQNMEQVIAEQYKQKFEKLIAKLQENQVDPIGLGVYVQAQQYPYWTELKQVWGQVFSTAKIEVNPTVTIRGFGITM